MNVVIDYINKRKTIIKLKINIHFLFIASPFFSVCDSKIVIDRLPHNNGTSIVFKIIGWQELSSILIEGSSLVMKINTCKDTRILLKDFLSLRRLNELHVLKNSGILLPFDSQIS